MLMHVRTHEHAIPLRPRPRHASFWPAPSSLHPFAATPTLRPVLACRSGLHSFCLSFTRGWPNPFQAI